MENDWDLYIDLDKYVFKLEDKKENTNIPFLCNKVFKKSNLRKINYLYTIVEEEEKDSYDFFKHSPILEKNKYANSFSQYKLKK
jgi:hypothetical protein